MSKTPSAPPMENETIAKAVEGMEIPTAAAFAMPDMGSIGPMFDSMSEFSPIIITGFLIMTSMFNHDVKAFVWLIPVIFWLIFVRMLQPYVGEKVGPACQQSAWLGSHQNPSMSSFLIMYTLAYLATPMAVYSNWNIMAVAAFLFLFGVDTIVKTKSKCASKWGVVNGGVLGLFTGGLMYFILSAIGMQKLLYMSIGDSNKVFCTKPKEQNFKCNVYKNGNIISSL